MTTFLLQCVLIGLLSCAIGAELDTTDRSGIVKPGIDKENLPDGDAEHEIPIRREAHPDEHPRARHVEALFHQAERMARSLGKLEDATFTDVEERKRVLKLIRYDDNELEFHSDTTCGAVKRDVDKLSHEVHDYRNKIKTSEELATSSSRKGQRTQHQRMVTINQERLKTSEKYWKEAQVLSAECDRLERIVSDLKPRVQRLINDVESARARGDL